VGISEVCVVIGFGGEQVRRAAAGVCDFLENPHYAHTNSLYSLVLARRWVRGEVLIANGDVLAHPEIFRRLAAARGNALAFDSRSGQDPEHMKVAHSPEGRLRAIDKLLPAPKVHGESLGLFRVAADDASDFFADAASVLEAGGPLQWAPAGLARFALRRPVDCLDVSGWPWCEIDFPEDMDRARQEVWRQIEEATAGAWPLAVRG
jgi:choline kinase